MSKMETISESNSKTPKAQERKPSDVDDTQPIKIPRLVSSISFATTLGDDSGMNAAALVMSRTTTKRNLLEEGDLNEEEQIKDVKNVALVSHNNMKPTMRNFVRKFKDVLKNYTLVGTQTTLTMVNEEMKEYADKGELKLGAACLSGPFGGDAQLAAEIAIGNIGCLIFFVDPLSAHPHDADVQCLLRLARVHEILLATNEMTAYCIVEALRHSLTFPGFSSDAVLPMSTSEKRMTESAVVYKAENAKKLKSLTPKKTSFDESVDFKGKKHSSGQFKINKRPKDDDSDDESGHNIDTTKMEE